MKNNVSMPFPVQRCPLVKHVCVFLASFFFVFVGHSQSPFLDTLQADLQHYREQVVQEKVYLHTDKTFYLTGETIWFKSYVVHAGTHQPMALSKVLYVELLDGQSKPVQQAMIALSQGTGDGAFVLPPSLQSGSYLLRAYTAWMKNFDEELYFHMPLQVVNTTRRPNWASTVKKRGYAIQFFPEGGNLVEGISTKLGFQLVDAYGRGVNGQGYVIENGKDTVARFRPIKFGIGSFPFTPRQGATYRAAVHLPDGDTVAGLLPSVEKAGYVLQVSATADDRLLVSVATNQANANTAVYLLAHTRGELKFSATKNLTPTKTEWFLDKGSLDDGITSFTLFDKNHMPVCERLYFKRPSRRINLGLQTDAAVYAPRSKVSLSLSPTDQQGQTTAGDFSLSVFLLDSLQGFPQQSIEDYFWLTSELKGTVEQPNYYLSATGKEADEAVDNLLLTHGWRRFRWEAVRSKSKRSFTFLPEYEGHIIRGRVTNKSSGSPVSDRLCFLSAPGERFQVSNAVSNEKGELTFVLKNCYGPVELLAQADRADSTVQIELVRPFPAPGISYQLPLFSLQEKWQQQLYGRHVGVQVSYAFAPADANRFQVPVQHDTGVFYGRPDFRFPLDEYTRFPTMEEVMREVVRGVQVRRESDSFRLHVLNLPYQEYFNDPPLLLLDGVPVYTTNKIIGFDPLKVKGIDVVTRKYYWGHTINNGIVSLRTYDGNLANFSLDPGVVLIEYNGLQMQREFYSPSYESAAKVQSREPDRRNVLLWQPVIKTGTAALENIHFYTSDVRGRYAIFVEGVDAAGRCGSKWVTIVVR